VATCAGVPPLVSTPAFNEARRLKAEHKDIPVYLVAEDMCASGCYYIAAAADKIYADPSSIVGSIGVVGRRPPLAAPPPPDSFAAHPALYVRAIRKKL